MDEIGVAHSRTAFARPLLEGIVGRSTAGSVWVCEVMPVQYSTHLTGSSIAHG